MTEPRMPQNEVTRIAALRRLDILFTPAEERFDRITRLAQRLFKVPIALVSLVAEDCQWFKSRQGLDAPETDRRISFCGHAILASEPFIVPDTLLDDRFRDNPLVTGDPFIRFYAGVPVADMEGQNVGTLCIIDRVPHQFGEAEANQLVDLAHWVESEIRLTQQGEIQKRMVSDLDDAKLKARIDVLTQCWNRQGMEELLLRSYRSTASAGTGMAILMLDIDHVKQVNDTRGHAAGHQVLRHVAQKIRGEIRADDILFRYGGEEFLLVLNHCTQEVAVDRAEKIRRSIETSDVTCDTGPVGVTISIGISVYSPEKGRFDSDTLIKSADQALYSAKAEGRNRVILQSYT